MELWFGVQLRFVFDILFLFCYDIWLFVIHVIHNLFLRLLLRQEVAIRPLRWHFWGLCSRKRYAIHAFPVWFMYANYALYLIICGVPKWKHYVRCVILNMCCLLILMPLLHDFCEIPYTLWLCDDFVLWIWNLCIFLIGFWVISGFVWHSGSLVEHWS